MASMEDRARDSASCSRNGPSIPLEICEIIIDIISECPEPFSRTLKEISLTCKALLNRCRSYIFKQISLIPNPPSELSGPVGLPGVSPLFCFARLLQSNADIGYHVREIVYSFHKGDRDLDFLVTLPDLFRHLSRVESFTMYPVSLEPDWLLHLTAHDDFSVIDWQKGISKDLRRSLETIIASPSLTSLVLKQVHKFPMEILAAARNLQDLELNDVKFTSDLDFVAPSTPSYLRKLVLDVNSARAVRALTDTKNAPIIDLSRISELAVHSDEHAELRLASDILDSSDRIASFTQIISFRENYLRRFRQDLISAKTLKTLKKFRFHLVDDSNVEGPDPVAYLCDIFDTWVGNNIVEEISIEFDAEFFHTIRTGEVWRRLSALANQEMFPFLRLVYIEIYLDIPDESKVELLVDTINGYRDDELKELTQSQRIKFSLVV